MDIHLNKSGENIFQCGVSCFLDLDTSASQAPQFSREVARPWKAFWPPSINSNTYESLSVTCPEALSWNFNSITPFDRPWRSWTRSAAAKREHTIGQEEQLKINSYSEFGPRNSQVDENKSTRCAELDNELQIVKMSRLESTPFQYLAPLELYVREKPYLSRLPFLPNLRRTNIFGQEVPVTVYNIFGHEKLFTLEKSGFEFKYMPFKVMSWSDQIVIEEYIPVLREWLKNYFDCATVFIYAFNFRGESGNTKGNSPWKSPFFRVHCDATSRSCLRRLQLHLPCYASENRRIRFVNVWRPITGPYQDYPLALCDFRTIRQEDLVPADVIFPHYCDEGYELFYSGSHRWFYKKGMSTDEVILFKLDDNKKGEAKFCPHSAFVDSTVPADTPKRASIEVRAIVVDKESF